MKFYSANIQHSHGFQNYSSRPAFRHKLKAYKTPSEEGWLRGQDTVNVGFALLCEAGESSSQPAQETSYQAEVYASWHLQWENG